MHFGCVALVEQHGSTRSSRGTRHARHVERVVSRRAKWNLGLSQLQDRRRVLCAPNAAVTMSRNSILMTPTTYIRVKISVSPASRQAAGARSIQCRMCRYSLRRQSYLSVAICRRGPSIKRPRHDDVERTTSHDARLILCRRRPHMTFAGRGALLQHVICGYDLIRWVRWNGRVRPPAEGELSVADSLKQALLTRRRRCPLICCSDMYIRDHPDQSGRAQSSSSPQRPHVSFCRRAPHTWVH